MKKQTRDLPVLAFESATSLRRWLLLNHAASEGIWLKLFKKNSGIPSVTFEEALDEGLCSGWSESLRRNGDDQFYPQRFTPRRTKGTASARNREHIGRLIRENRMTLSGLPALETHKPPPDRFSPDPQGMWIRLEDPGRSSPATGAKDRQVPCS